MDFRPLKADEIDVRVATVKDSGCSLLLYKDARVDMQLLDETVGSMNWQRNHTIIDGNLYCTIEIWDKEKQQWIAKQDVGTESFTEKEKGQASDSFKRAGFNVGIGRELYTAPFIWVSDVKIDQKNGKYTTYERFSVKDIGYTDEKPYKITHLEIINSKGRIVYQYGKRAKNNANKEESKPLLITNEQAQEMFKIVGNQTMLMKKIMSKYGYKSSKDILQKDLENIINDFNNTKNNE